MPNFPPCRRRSLEIHTSELHNRVSKQIRISECYDFVLGYAHNDPGTYVVPRPQMDMPEPFTHSNQVSVNSGHTSPPSLFHDLLGLLAPCSPFPVVQNPSFHSPCWTRLCRRNGDCIAYGCCFAVFLFFWGL